MTKTEANYKYSNMTILKEYIADLNDYYDGKIKIEYEIDNRKKKMIIRYTRDNKRVRVEHNLDIVRQYPYIEDMIDNDLTLIRQGGYIW